MKRLEVVRKVREIKSVEKKEGATKNNRSLINQTYSYENKIKIVFNLSNQLYRFDSTNIERFFILQNFFLFFYQILIFHF